jgi:hypothetical protein
MDLLLIPRVPDQEIPPRLRHFVDRVRSMFNSFIREGRIELVGENEWDLTGDLAIGGEVEGGTPYLVLYIGPTGLLAQDADFVYDPTNNVLRVPLFAASRSTVPNTTELPTGSYSFFTENADP